MAAAQRGGLAAGDRDSGSDGTDEVTTAGTSQDGECNAIPLGAYIPVTPRGTRRDSGPRCRRKADHTPVSTPWFPLGVSRRRLDLGDEVRALWRLLRLTPAEVRAREEAISDLRVVVAASNSRAVVRVRGSFATDLSLPSSAVDLTCDWDYEQVERLRPEAEAAGFTMEVSGDSHATFTRNGVVCSLALSSEESKRAWAVVKETRALLAQFPHCGAVYSVVRTLRHQALGASSVSSYALLCMTLHACHATDDEGDALRLFCRLFGASGAAADQPCWIEDPCIPGHNVVAGCGAFPKFRQEVHRWGEALAGWQCCGKGYSARSPLSSIVAFGDLWSRVDDAGPERSPAWAPEPGVGCDEE
eukprot:Hpha_TRINITY_DN16487_c0_g1::TRINITY_DN16487_c0_g1_i1::g.163288::m.163288